MKRLPRKIPPLTDSLTHLLTTSPIMCVCLLLLTQIATACPLCKEALFSPGEGQALSQAAHAFNLSIVTLASVPCVLVGGIAWLIARSSRRVPR